ncbi:sugar phosphate isomerase/epimerase [Azoarcus sp. L1K30]|uniref:sugar phosphate isomerase/epimerase family protein n=1 Tax=Azoarcus sp. L1K30 TaxID=2820277 RepID=UPI001B836E09|nr:sugar phosphate isomerase/epimerase [Azoarcus sp. L1K30]
MDFDSVALDTGSMAGPLEVRLEASIDRGFRKLVFSASDLVNHPAGVEAAAELVRRSGVEVLALRQLRDFEGLVGPLHLYKVNVAQGLMNLCRLLGAPTLLVSASTIPGAHEDPARVVRDLAKLATMAVPKRIDIAYEAVPESRVAGGIVRAEDQVCEADRANLGVAIDSGHLFTSDDGLDAVDACYGHKLFLVGLSDTIARDPNGQSGDRADFVRVFPGDGSHGADLIELVRRLRKIGFHGGFYLNATNADYAQLPADFVAARASDALMWLQEHLRHVDLPRRRIRGA